MHLLVIVLNREEFLNEILEAFVEIGVTGATILDSAGMGKTLAYHIPIFAGLKKSIQTSGFSKTIFSLIQDEETLEKIIYLIEEIVDFNTHGTGILFVVPVSLAKGIDKEELTW